jgi:type IV pilus assembly protein PilN
MARINLLPWRDAERRRRQRQFAIAAFSAATAVLLIGLVLRFQLDSMSDAQEERNNLLSNEIRLLDVRIKEVRELEATKADLLARMGVIQELQQSRPEIVHLFDAVVNAIPEGVYLTRLTQTGSQIVVEGRAQSNARVSAFMRNIDAAQWINDPVLLLIENKDQTGTGLSHFRLGFAQKRQEQATEQAMMAPQCSRSPMPSLG